MFTSTLLNAAEQDVSDILRCVSHIVQSEMPRSHIIQSEMPRLRMFYFWKYDIKQFVFSLGNDSSRSDIYPWKLDLIMPKSPSND